MNSTIESTRGQPVPLGATVTKRGTNFAIFSRHCSKVWLLLFQHQDDKAPSHKIELDPDVNRTGEIWHIHLKGVGHGQLYQYHMAGPYEPKKGHRYNPHKPLLDPYAKVYVGASEWDFGPATGYNPAAPEVDLSFSTVTDYKNSPKCMVYGDDGFDWQDDRPLNRPLNETIIYETHVRSLTCDPSAQAQYPGTYLGVIEMIPYFQELGITAVELLPIHQFNEHEFERYNPKTGERLINYWGYNTLGFFAPHENYSHNETPGSAVLEFKQMVQALHKAGLEVILDVVFNHTVEGNERGPTFGFRGIDNRVYYILDNNRRYYRNYSGTGNTLNASHPIVQDFIIECLRYWVQEMHVDGFRFDLATALCRNERGHIPAEPPLPIRIAEDPLLRGTKIIAEPWDIGGYQVGSYPGRRWCEWNDRYRDQLREFWRGDPGLTSALATRIAGNSDLYGFTRLPNHSINFIAAHDGFTLNDLISYNSKHNEANGENNADGHNHNISYNYGWEGPTDDPHIEALRSRQARNFLATLLLSQGTPMLNGGDEFRRTQEGNNNAYCQNNEISWYNWARREEYADLVRFVKHLIALRKKHPIFRRRTFFTGLDLSGKQVSDIRWYKPTGEHADWQSYPRQLMCVLNGAKENIGCTNTDDIDVIIMFNSDFRSQLYYLPPSPTLGRRWHVALDTGIPTPNDIFEPGNEVELEETLAYHLHPRSMAVLVTKPANSAHKILRLKPHKHIITKPPRQARIKTSKIYRIQRRRRD